MSVLGFMKIGKSLIGTMFTTPETSAYPKGGLILYDNARGSLAIDNAKCTLCGLCDRRCPAGAIRVDREKEQLLIDRTKCIACGECIYECPEKCLEMSREYTEPENSIVIDVFSATAVPGSNNILKNIEKPMDLEEVPEDLRKSMLKTRRVQAPKRINRNSAKRRNNKTFTKYRNKRYDKR